jgi:hypothetical protein
MFVTHRHIVSSKKIVCCIQPQYQPHKHHTSPSSTSKVYVAAMTTLLTKMKVAVDKANMVCTSNNDESSECDDCHDAWSELDRLAETYLTMSRSMKTIKKKTLSSNANNEWDVIS